MRQIDKLYLIYDTTRRHVKSTMYWRGISHELQI